MNKTGSGYIELRTPMMEWLEERAEAIGVTAEELVAHILLEYRELLEASDDVDDDEESEDEQKG